MYIYVYLKILFEVIVFKIIPFTVETKNASALHFVIKRKHIFCGCTLLVTVYKFKTGELYYNMLKNAIWYAEKLP